MTVYPTPGSPPPSTSSWDDTETLVDEPMTPTPNPRHFNALAPQHISDINVRGRLTTLRLRPGQQLGPIVYGNGRWVLHRNPGRPATNTNTSNNSSSFAEQALTAILQRQPPATTTANRRAERPNEQRSHPEPEDEQRRRTEDAQIALVQRMLVSMGYSYARQRTLHYHELSAVEQHELALQIMAEFGVDDVTVAAAADAAAARLEEEERHQQRLREEEESAEEGCCTLREFENGVACERCMRWGGEIWEL